MTLGIICESSAEDLLFDVEDEIENGGGEAHADKMENFVVEG